MKGGRDGLWAIVALVAWAISGDTGHVTGVINVPPESTAGLLVVLLFGHRMIRDVLLPRLKRKHGSVGLAPPSM